MYQPTFNLTPAQQAVRYNPEKFDPNSVYWRMLAEWKGLELGELIGKENSHIWAEMTWPGDTINALTYQQAAQGFISALDLGKDALLDMLECTCREDRPICCEPCRAAARIRARSADVTIE